MPKSGKASAVKSKKGGDKKETVRATTRAGLVFPPSRCNRMLK
tara:strand:- start:394 stop:522 length:129 start_codon:yes stop_codon:yes gene_type:complete